MLVDEFQDIDEVQYELLMCYSRNGTLITGVGDDDQSLYSFRHALGFSGMMRFMQDTKAQMITLPINYRSGPLIIEKAATLISKNASRVPKEMQAGKQTTCNIYVCDFPNENEEADEVCKTIITIGGEFKEFAVLARNNRQLDKVETSLKSMNIPYSRTGEKFMDLPEPQAIISLLRSLVDNSSAGLRHSLMWIGIPDVLLDSFVNDHNCDVQSLYAHTPRDNPNKKTLKEFIEIYSQWLSLLEQGGKDSLVIKGVSSFFKRFCDEKKHRHFDSAEIILNRYRGTIKQRLGQLINDNDKRKDGVSLMTIHASKGLEFDSVWIVGANDIVMPGENTGEDLLQEERRIFYVAMTRARENLFISHTDLACRFINEAKLCE
jgi:superfamily I DNA/RNA helicase